MINFTSRGIEDSHVELPPAASPAIRVPCNQTNELVEPLLDSTCRRADKLQRLVHQPGLAAAAIASKLRFTASRHIPRVRRHSKQPDFGVKTIGQKASFIYLVNQIFGTGVIAIPNLFAASGWLPSIVVDGFVCLAATLGTLMMLRCMTMVAGNRNFEKRLEYMAVMKCFLCRPLYQVIQVCFYFSILASNLVSVIVVAQASEHILGRFAGGTLAFQAYPQLKFEALGQDELDKIYVEPNGALKLRISLGYILTAAACIPLAQQTMEENMKVQYTSFAFLLMTIGGLIINALWRVYKFTEAASSKIVTASTEPGREIPLPFGTLHAVAIAVLGTGHYLLKRRLVNSHSFSIPSRATGRQLSELPVRHPGAFGSASYGELMSTFLASYSFVNLIPSWANEMTWDVDAVLAVKNASVFAFVVYCVFGYVMAFAYPDAHTDNILQAVLAVDTRSRWPALLVYAFDLITVAPGILVYCIATRYNLLNSKLCSRRWAIFWGSGLPFCIAWLVSDNSHFSAILTWSSLVFSLMVNFIAPCLIFLVACCVSRPSLRNPAAIEIEKKTGWFISRHCAATSAIADFGAGAPLSEFHETSTAFDSREFEYIRLQFRPGLLGSHSLSSQSDPSGEDTPPIAAAHPPMLKPAMKTVRPHYKTTCGGGAYNQYFRITWRSKGRNKSATSSPCLDSLARKMPHDETFNYLAENCFTPSGSRGLRMHPRMQHGGTAARQPKLLEPPYLNTYRCSDGGSSRVSPGRASKFFVAQVPYHQRTTPHQSTQQPGRAHEGVRRRWSPHNEIEHGSVKLRRLNAWDSISSRRRALLIERRHMQNFLSQSQPLKKLHAAGVQQPWRFRIHPELKSVMRASSHFESKLFRSTVLDQRRRGTSGTRSQPMKSTSMCYSRRRSSRWDAPPFQRANARVPGLFMEELEGTSSMESMGVWARPASQRRQRMAWKSFSSSPRPEQAGASLLVGNDDLEDDNPKAMDEERKRDLSSVGIVGDATETETEEESMDFVFTANDFLPKTSPSQATSFQPSPDALMNTMMNLQTKRSVPILFVHPANDEDSGGKGVAANASSINSRKLILPVDKSRYIFPPDPYGSDAAPGSGSRCSLGNDLDLDPFFLRAQDEGGGSSCTMHHHSDVSTENMQPWRTPRPGAVVPVQEASTDDLDDHHDQDSVLSDSTDTETLEPIQGAEDAYAQDEDIFGRTQY